MLSKETPPQSKKPCSISLNRRNTPTDEKAPASSILFLSLRLGPSHHSWSKGFSQRRYSLLLPLLYQGSRGTPSHCRRNPLRIRRAQSRSSHPSTTPTCFRCFANCTRLPPCPKVQNPAQDCDPHRRPQSQTAHFGFEKLPLVSSLVMRKEWRRCSKYLSEKQRAPQTGQVFTSNRWDSRIPSGSTPGSLSHAFSFPNGIRKDSPSFKYPSPEALTKTHFVTHNSISSPFLNQPTTRSSPEDPLESSPDALRSKTA